ncbi:MAG: glycosyltransferase family 39 protein [Henriciella sp.]|nr:glycosyltransferase family 39 protein [Henriciella sp.]
MTRWFSDRDHQILTAILLLAFGLRIWGLNAPLWYDEITTVETHLRLPWDEMMTSYSMNHHYLYSLQAKLVAGVFGEAAWTVRLPAMLFGVGSIAAMWCLAKRVAGVRLAHITALLLALSFHHIWFSQNARGYTELAFWSTLGMIFFLDGMRDPKLKTWLAYAACLALAIATHLTGFFFFAAQGLIWLGFAVLNVRRLGLMSDPIRIPALSYIVGGVATLIFYAPILSSVFEVTSAVAETSQVDVMQEYQNPLWSILEAFRTVLGSLGPVLGIIAAAVIALSIIGAVRLRGQSPYFAPIVGLHIALTMALLLALGMRIWPRFFFVDIGFLMLLIIVGVYASCVWIWQIVTFVPPKAVFPAAVAAMTLLSIGLATSNYTAPKQNLVGAVDYINSTETSDARVYGVGVAGSLYNSFYGTGWPPIETEAAFDTAMAEPGPVYLVIAFPGRSFRVLPKMEEMADSGQLELVKRFRGTLGDGNVLIFKRV